MALKANANGTRLPALSTSSEAAAAALNESSGLCRTGAGRRSVFIKEKTSSLPNKEPNYKHSSTGHRGRNLRAERDPVAAGSD